MSDKLGRTPQRADSVLLTLEQALWVGMQLARLVQGWEKASTGRSGRHFFTPRNVMLTEIKLEGQHGQKTFHNVSVAEDGDAWGTFKGRWQDDIEGVCYISPETVSKSRMKRGRQELLEPKARSNLYSIGMVLFRTISGKCPFGHLHIGDRTIQMAVDDLRINLSPADPRALTDLIVRSKTIDGECGTGMDDAIEQLESPLTGLMKKLLDLRSSIKVTPEELINDINALKEKHGLTFPEPESDPVPRRIPILLLTVFGALIAMAILAWLWLGREAGPRNPWQEVARTLGVPFRRSDDEGRLRPAIEQRVRDSIASLGNESFKDVTAWNVQAEVFIPRGETSVLLVPRFAAGDIEFQFFHYRVTTPGKPEEVSEHSGTLTGATGKLENWKGNERMFRFPALLERVGVNVSSDDTFTRALSDGELSKIPPELQLKVEVAPGQVHLLVVRMKRGDKSANQESSDGRITAYPFRVWGQLVSRPSVPNGIDPTEETDVIKWLEEDLGTPSSTIAIVYPVIVAPTTRPSGKIPGR